MKFKLELECDNDAFHGDGCEAEVVRIIETLRFVITTGDSAAQARIPLRDINGNRVGEARFIED